MHAHRLRTLLNVRARINLSMASPVNHFDGNFILNGVFATKGYRIHLLLTKENISWEIENVPKCKCFTRLCVVVLLCELHCAALFYQLSVGILGNIADKNLIMQFIFIMSLPMFLLIAVNVNCDSVINQIENKGFDLLRFVCGTICET